MPTTAPFFLLFALHRRCIRVLHFEPIRRAAGTVGRVLPLRDNAFEAKLAGMGEDGRAVALDMLIEPDAGAGLGHDRGERGLADLKRITPEVRHRSVRTKPIYPMPSGPKRKSPAQACVAASDRIPIGSRFHLPSVDPSSSIFCGQGDAFFRGFVPAAKAPIRRARLILPW